VGLAGPPRARKCKGLLAQTLAAALDACKEHFPVVANGPRDGGSALPARLPALRRSLTKQRKGLYDEGENPETKRGSAGGRAKAGKGAQSQNATKQTPAFINAHAKQTGRHRATIAREIREAEKISDALMTKIVGTSLDKQSDHDDRRVLKKTRSLKSGGSFWEASQLTPTK
jgi:hypothetical protein